MNRILCRDAVKRFKDFTAVDHVSIAVESGVCALLGPNGAGKSTLLKMLTGLLPFDSGSTTICGLDVATQPIEVRKIIGVLPEDLGLFDSLTVQEHLELSGPIYGVGKKETRDRAAALLRVLRLDHARDIFIDQCSHGMKKAMRKSKKERIRHLNNHLCFINSVYLVHEQLSIIFFSNFWQAF